MAAERSHSPQGSVVSSTTSDLLVQSKVSSPLTALQQGAQQDRSRLEGMLEAYKNSSDEASEHSGPQSSTTNEEDYEDADDFIVNRSNPHSKHSSFHESAADDATMAVPEAQDDYTDVEDSHDDTVQDTTQEDIEHSDAVLGQPTNISTHTLNSGSDDFAFERPMIINTNLANLHSTSALPSPTMNRRSMISEYAGSIHEVNTVVVPDEAQAVVSSRPSIVKISRNPSKSSKKNQPAPPTHEKTISAISHDSAATNTPSGSGSEKYPDASIYSGKDSQYHQVQDDSAIATSQHSHHGSTDTFDFDVGPLNTKKEHVVAPVEKQYLTAVNPAIPSRSPRRPVSAIGFKSPVNSMISSENESRRTKSEQITGVDDLVDEINTSMHLDDAPSIAAEDIKQRDVSQPRPLPPPPVPVHRVITPQSVKSQPAELAKGLNDDGFVTEDEEEELKQEKKKKSKKSKKRSSTFKKGHFNHDTLVTLLQATEGTIIGQEFQDIGMQPQDKQLVERLVDSLSRLTADMIVDGDRREESIKRLSKAIKALEGF